MITLHGILRQSGVNEYDGKKKTKVWLEHTSPRENGVPDLKLEELFLDGDCSSALPKAGGPIVVSVRPYAFGKGVKFAAIAVVPPGVPVLAKS